MTAPYTTLPILNNSFLRSMLIYMPPMDVQREYTLAVERERSRVQRLTDRLTRQLNLLQEHRQALITAAVTGELDIPGVAA